MTDDTLEFALEPSGTFPRTDHEIRWPELPRRKLEGHPMVFDGFHVELADGRTFELVRMNQSYIYAYALMPMLCHPDVIVKTAIEQVRHLAPRVPTSPVVLPPNLLSSDHPMPSRHDEPDLGSGDDCLTLPRVQVIAEFLSSKASVGSSESFSSLVVIWFQDNFGDIPAEIQKQLTEIEWDLRAHDWTP
jgi:hypothetical protein